MNRVVWRLRMLICRFVSALQTPDGLARASPRMARRRTAIGRREALELAPLELAAGFQGFEELFDNPAGAVGVHEELELCTCLDGLGSDQNISRRAFSASRPAKRRQPRAARLVSRPRVSGGTSCTPHAAEKHRHRRPVRAPLRPHLPSSVPRPSSPHAARARSTQEVTRPRRRGCRSAWRARANGSV
jgi:hypothetical protein